MAAGAALPKSRIVSTFKLPPSLSTKHEEELHKRAISKEFALGSGIRTAADNELSELNFQASLPCEERSKGLQGICFPYVDLELNAEAAWRIKPDTTFTMSDGSHPKYLSRIGDKLRAFFPQKGVRSFSMCIRRSLFLGTFISLKMIEPQRPLRPSRSRRTLRGLRGLCGSKCAARTRYL